VQVTPSPNKPNRWNGATGDGSGSALLLGTATWKSMIVSLVLLGKISWLGPIADHRPVAEDHHFQEGIQYASPVRPYSGVARRK
jgi:hypothetical protein